MTTLPCCNYVEHDDGTATACLGTMTLLPAARQYRCDVCRGWCGSLAHPTCRTPWVQP